MHHDRLPLHPVPVQKVLEDCRGQCYGLAEDREYVTIKDFLSKFPLVFPVPDQKAFTLVCLVWLRKWYPYLAYLKLFSLTREQTMDVCKMLGIPKLNTMVYHPQCDGMVEQFN